VIPPTPSTASVVFVGPIGAPRKPGEEPPAEGPPSVFLAVARGVLYALDEDGGHLLWAVRVGYDVTDPPAVARVDLGLGEGRAALVLVSSNVAGPPAPSAYMPRSGILRWHQPLDVPDAKAPTGRRAVPAAGPAVVAGTRAYVPVRDAIGTVFEFDLRNGQRVG